MIIRYYTSDGNLISPIHPIPEGSSENQFAPFRVGVNKLICNKIIK